MRQKKTNFDLLRWVKSSGNVFADLGVPNPELALLKADISIAIEQAIERKGISSPSEKRGS